MLDAILKREVIVGLAIVGAILATGGSLLRYRAMARPIGDITYWFGYIVTGISIVLFIIAGFRT